MTFSAVKKRGGLGRRTFLLLGDAEDVSCDRVQQELHRRGHDVLRTTTPLTDPFAMSLWITKHRAAHSIWRDARGQSRTIAGVLLRRSSHGIDPVGWNPKDLAYMEHETRAALLAWLWSLPCPVVSRPAADSWFRPHRSYPEWHQLFADCGLPVAPICITNEASAARAFGRRWQGRASYAPLSSTRRYLLTQASHWDELMKLLAHVPVCLVPPLSGKSIHATVISDRVVWDEGLRFDASAFHPGLVRLARRLRLDWLQVEIATESHAVYCMTVDPFPLIERHDAVAQATVIDGLIELLGGMHRVDGAGASTDRPQAEGRAEVFV